MLGNAVALILYKTLYHLTLPDPKFSKILPPNCLLRKRPLEWQLSRISDNLFTFSAASMRGRPISAKCSDHLLFGASSTL
jgi:hypothetical protein